MFLINAPAIATTLISVVKVFSSWFFGSHILNKASTCFIVQLQFFMWRYSSMLMLLKTCRSTLTVVCACQTFLYEWTQDKVKQIFNIHFYSENERKQRIFSDFSGLDFLVYSIDEAFHIMHSLINRGSPRRTWRTRGHYRSRTSTEIFLVESKSWCVYLASQRIGRSLLLQRLIVSRNHLNQDSFFSAVFRKWPSMCTCVWRPGYLRAFDSTAH